MALVTARKTVAVPGTAEALSAASKAFTWIAISAESDNAGIVAVGDASADATATTQQGALLRATDQPLVMHAKDGVDDLKNIYIDASVAGDGVSYAYLSSP